MNGDATRSLSGNLSATAVQEIGEIHDFGLAGGVFENGISIGQRSSHDDIFSAAHCGHVESDFGTPEMAALADDVAFFQFEDRTHLLKAFEVLIHGACANGAAAGQSDLCPAEAGKERAEAEYGGAHGAHEVIGCLVDQRAGLHCYGMIRIGTVAAEDFQKLESGVDVPQVGDIFESLGSFQQNGRKKDGKCRVFGAVDVNFPVERDAAFNNQFVHENILGCVSGYRLADKRSATGRGVVF